MTTPKKLVHWAHDLSLSSFGSPFLSETSSSASPRPTSSSTLHYINNQLIAHGFASSPLSLESLESEEDRHAIVKCLMSMLSQRVEDMERAEELGGKLRTEAYENERMKGMLKAERERADYAEKEAHLHKSRLATQIRALTASQASHKQLSLDLQRARSSLLALRQTHISELKKKEKDVEKILSRFSSQLSTLSSNIRIANDVEGVEGQVIGQGQGYLELALEQAESVRNELSEENGILRRCVVGVVNEVQGVVHLAKSLVDGDATLEEPAPQTQTSLFPIHPTVPTAATERLTTLFASLRESLILLQEKTSMPSPKGKDSEAKEKEKAERKGEKEENERLRKIIEGLRVEIEQVQAQLSAQTLQTQTLFDQVSKAPPLHTRLESTTVCGDESVDLFITPIKDEEKERLEVTKKELDEERKKFTEAAVRLGREREKLEAERIKFLDEKRSWQVQLMLNELPPTPGPASMQSTSDLLAEPQVFRKSTSPRKPKQHSPKKSPTKTMVGKTGKTRVSRRSSSGLRLGTRLELSFETEVVPPILSAEMSGKPSKVGFSPSLLPTSFVLPPPSPHSSLPRAPALLSSAPLASLAPTVVEPLRSLEDQPPAEIKTDPALITPPPRHPFPVAKPFASRMVHAYSPAKPSPLSRILMLNDSPESVESGVRLEEVLPIPMPPEDSLLKEKKVEVNVNVKKVGETEKEKRFTTKEKGKAKADPLLPSAAVKGRMTGAVEKENQVKSKTSRISPLSSSGYVPASLNSRVKTTFASKPAPTKVVKVVPKVGTKLAPGKGGPRRVPIDSAEAAPVGPGWRG